MASDDERSDVEVIDLSSDGEHQEEHVASEGTEADEAIQGSYEGDAGNNVEVRGARGRRGKQSLLFIQV